MRLRNWSRYLSLRLQRRREKLARRELLAPVCLSVRKLEERRVLDVSAAFMTATGVLEVDITNTSDVATVQQSSGDVSIRDTSNSAIDIDVDGGGPAAVALNDVKRIVVRGDAAADQTLVLDAPLSLADGLDVQGGIDSAVLRDSITSAAGISLGSDVVLENDVTLVGSDLTFAGTIDSQADATHSLTIDVGTGPVAFNGDIGAITPLRGLDIQRAESGVRFGGTSPVGIISSTDSISVGSTSAIGGAGIAFNAGTDATLRITTTGDDVTINGASKLQSNLSINTGTKAGNITFSDASPVDSETGERNDLTLDAGEGSVFLNRDIGGDEAIGELRIASASGGVTIGDTSPVTIVRAANGIDIGVGASEIAGSGIRLNGFNSTLFFETNNAHIRMNGPMTIASSVTFGTGPGLGNVILTNDTPVDSETGELNDLVFDVGMGRVLVNEDLGRTNRLGSLTVMSAGGGAVFGEARTEVPGAGGQGPVEVINIERGIDLGVGTNLIGGSGVVFRGSAVARAVITTNGGDVRVNGATTLGTDLTVTTGTSGGNLTFTSNSPVDGVTGTTSSLTLDLGAGALFFNADIGSSTPLGRFTVVTSNAGVTFGDSDPMHLIRASQPIDIGTQANVIGGAGITFNGGASQFLIATSNADIRLNGAIHARSDIAIDSGDGGGAIVLTSSATIDSHDQSTPSGVILDAGSGTVSINADLGSQRQLGSLDIERAAGGVFIGGADVSAPGGTGPVTRVATSGSISIGSLSVISGGIGLDGGSSVLAFDAAAADINFNGPTEIRSDVSINTGGGDLTLSAASPINSQPGESNTLTMTLGQGNAVLAASIGATDPLRELRVVSAGDVMAQSGVHASRIVQQAGSGTTTFGQEINTADTLLPGIDLTGNAFAFHGPVATTGDGSVSITHAGRLEINASADMQLQGAFSESGLGSVAIAASIITNGDAIHFRRPVTLTGGDMSHILLDTTADGHLTGAAITFEDTVNAEHAEVETLTLNSGSSGDTSFSAAIGDVGRLGGLRIIRANDVLFEGPLTTAAVTQEAGHGITTFHDTIDTNSSIAKGIDIDTEGISFLGSVSTAGDGRVELASSAFLDLAATSGMNLSGSFLQTGGGTVRISSDITTNGTNITFTDEVILRESLRLDTGPGGGTLLFTSTLDGTNDCVEALTLAAGAGSVLFQDDVGGTVGLGDVRIENAADVQFRSSLTTNSIIQTTGSGETSFDGPVTIKSAAGIDLAAGTVAINNTLDTSTASGLVRIAAADDVLFTRHAAITTAGAGVMIRADADATTSGSGGAVLMSDGATIDTAGGVIEITSDENIQLGRLMTTTLVRLTSTSGGIIDGGDLGGPDIIADQLVMRTHSGIGTSDPIDTSVNTIAAENKRAGGVRFENSTGGSLTIGEVDGLSGIMTGPGGVPEKLVGDVEIIHVGAINVASPILNHGGGHTIVRAELPGDLTIDAPIQNRGGDGWIFLFSGGDLIINHSLPEPEAEISVENEGAIRGEARGEVIIDNSATNYVIVRTHAERFPATGPRPTLSAKFADPARYPPRSDTAFYLELEAELRAIRGSIAGQATNFAPIFDIEPVDRGGSDVDASGRVIVKVTIGDRVHLETNWHLTIDWGDGTIESYTVPGNPQASSSFLNSSGANANMLPDLTNTAHIDSGVNGQPGVYFVHHRYLAPPNPNDPAEPIPIFATLRYDAREEGEQALDLGRPGEGSGIFNGIRFFRNGTEPILATDGDSVTNPGEGSFFFIKIIESVIIPVESRQTETVYVAATTTTTSVVTGATIEFETASFEAETFEEYRLFMRVVDDVAARVQQAESGVSSAHAGESDQEYPLPLELLEDPLRIFREREFPNGHYRIYLEEIRTGRVRLILDVHIYEGRVVPENFREGAAERQPGSGDTSSWLRAIGNPIAESPASKAETATPVDGRTAILHADLPNDDADTDASSDDARLSRSSWFLPAAVSSLPWRARVRRAARSNARSIRRESLRFRRH